MRDIYKALNEFESSLEQVHGVSLNEAMVLCCINDQTLTASAISEQTGIKASHLSKVIRSIEEKKMIGRALGEKDMPFGYEMQYDRDTGNTETAL